LSDQELTCSFQQTQIYGVQENMIEKGQKGYTPKGEKAQGFSSAGAGNPSHSHALFFVVYYKE
jgi:hypothetical protein